MKIYLAGLNGRRWITEDHMRIYLAGQWPWRSGGIYDAAIQKHGVYVLDSFFYMDDLARKQIPFFKDFMLDSGAFTFFNGSQNAEKTKSTKWEEYVDRYADFIKTSGIQKFFELDIDEIIGYENVKRLRRRLEEKTGTQCIPVWHLPRGRDEFYRMCDEYKYVAIGTTNVNDEGRRIKSANVLDWFIATAHRNKCKIHGLGYTNLTGLTRHKFDSVDSTSWTSGNRFGHIFLFNGKTMIKVKKKSNQKIARHKAKEAALHNFTEWVKFQRYAEAAL